MAAIPEEYHDLFERKTIAHFVSLLPDGSPHAVPVWVDYDGEHVLVNSTADRRKTRNVREDSRVAVSMLDPEDPYRYLSIRGEVVEVTEESAVEHIHELSRRYTGEEYGNFENESSPRVIIRVRLERIL